MHTRTRLVMALLWTSSWMHGSIAGQAETQGQADSMTYPRAVMFFCLSGLYSTLCTLHSTLHFTLYTLPSALFTPHSPLQAVAATHMYTIDLDS